MIETKPNCPICSKNINVRSQTQLSRDPRPIFRCFDCERTFCEPITKSCKFCGENFTTTNNSRKYCNNSCTTLGNKRAIKNRFKSRFKKETIYCLWCGTGFLSSVSGQTKYCCHECGQFFRGLQQKIHKKYSFNRPKTDAKLAELDTLGKDTKLD